MSGLVQVIACFLFGAKLLSKLMLDYCHLDPQGQASVKFESKCKIFHSGKCIGKYRLRDGGHFVDELKTVEQVSTFSCPPQVACTWCRVHRAVAVPPWLLACWENSHHWKGRCCGKSELCVMLTLTFIFKVIWPWFCSKKNNIQIKRYMVCLVALLCFVVVLMWVDFYLSPVMLLHRGLSQWEETLYMYSHWLRPYLCHLKQCIGEIDCDIITTLHYITMTS